MAIPKLCRLPRHLYRKDLVRRAPLRAVKDYTGAVVNGCEIVGLAGFIHDSKTAWLYRCRCGKLGLVVSGQLVSGNVGCRCSRATHGLTRTPLYPIWRRIHHVCYDPKHPSYRLYGGRGATVCRRWRKSVSDFIEDVGRRPSGHYVLALIDVKRGFRPGNVRWITQSECSRGNDKGLGIEYRGERLKLSEWAKRLGTSYQTIFTRVKTCQALGADLSEAVATPVGQQMPCVWGKATRGRPRELCPRQQTTIDYRGQRLTVSQWARQLRMSYQTIYKRVATCKALGADLSEALATPIGEQMPCANGKVKRGRPRRLEWA